MPPQMRHGSRRALEEVYADLGPKLRARVRRRAIERHMDADSLEQDVDLTFMETYLDHDPEIGTFEGRIALKVYRRLGDKIRARKFAVRCESGESSHEIGVAAVEPEPYPMGALGRFLSADGRLVLAIIFDDPEESGYDFWEFFRLLPETVSPKAAFRTYLRGRVAWSENRVRAALEEVRAAL